MPLKPTTQLLVRDWKQDVVYLVQFPRFHSTVTASGFALKLETWLRFTKIDYHVWKIKI
jgi:hypothetical protein